MGFLAGTCGAGGATALPRRQLGGAGARLLAPSPWRRAARRAAAARRGGGGSSAAPLQVCAQQRTITPYPDPFPDLQPGEDLPADYGDMCGGPPTNRRAGVILHPTSLPGKYGTGEIGAEALRFVDWLADAGMQLWQVRRREGTRGLPCWSCVRCVLPGWLSLRLV